MSFLLKIENLKWNNLVVIPKLSGTTGFVLASIVQSFTELSLNDWGLPKGLSPSIR